MLNIDEKELDQPENPRLCSGKKISCVLALTILNIDEK